MTRDFKPGDRVSLTGTVKEVSAGHRHVWVKIDAYRSGAGEWFSPDALTLITPAEPPVGSVVVVDGVAWTRSRFGSYWGSPARGARQWPDLSHGDVVFTAGGDGA